MQEMLQFKITLTHSKPSIWRRVLVPSNYTLADLHVVIQVCFDWSDEHLFSFQLAGVTYDDRNPRELSEQLNALKITKKSKIVYLYDFGDNWEHTLHLEKIIHEKEDIDYASCTDGARAAPFEDSGGVLGYENKLVILADKSHPEFEEIYEWIGEDLKPEIFDINEINQQLKAL